MNQPSTRFGLTETWRRTPSLIGRLQPLLGRDFAVAYVFMLPTFLVMGGLIAYPFLRATYISFTRTHGATIGPFVGLANYRNTWSDRFFRESVAVTIRYTLWSVALTFAISTLAATLLHRLGARAGLLTGMMLLPWIMPEIVRAITWRGLLDPLHGGVNRVLINLGLIQRGYPFFGSIETALPSVIVVNVWQRVPFFVITLLAGLKGLDEELYEAAAIDGAGPWRQFLHVTLPGLRYVLIVVTLLGTIWSFNEFNLIFLLTAGGPMNATKVYSVLAYDLVRTRMGLGVAVAMSMAPVFLVLILLLGRYVMRGQGSAQDTASGGLAPVAGLLRMLIWPLRIALRMLVALFWLINDALEQLVGVVQSLLARLFPHESRRRRAHRRLVRVSALAALFILGLLLFFELAPFCWVFVTAFKTELQITRFESVLWPRPWSLQQFERLFSRDFFTWLQNTLLISLVTPAFSTLSAAAGAYALTRLRWRGAEMFGKLVLASYLMPTVMILLPIYHLFTRLGLNNNRLSLLISYPTFILPFALWVLMGYYATIPAEIEDAARIDGCGRYQAFWRIVLPLSRPALVATGLFGLSQAWSEFLYAMTFIVSESKMTVPMGLAQMIFGDVSPWGQLSAAALIMAAPVLAIYTLGQRFMVAGLVAGSVKG
ncbi:MAG: ABC transporter permease subunit [Anaerolineae bacterium]|nr:ABC transporter permease subunit [Anaerolineae bacterium]